MGADELVKMGDFKRWDELGLKDFNTFADKIRHYNTYDNGECDVGEWFFPGQEKTTDGRWVVYGGTYGTAVSPGAWDFSWAEIFDDEGEFAQRVAELEAMPELDPELDHSDDDDDEEEEDYSDQEPDHGELKENEDFEQADEYFGHYGGGDDY